MPHTLLGNSFPFGNALLPPSPDSPIFSSLPYCMIFFPVWCTRTHWKTRTTGPGKMGSDERRAICAQFIHPSTHTTPFIQIVCHLLRSLWSDREEGKNEEKKTAPRTRGNDPVVCSSLLTHPIYPHKKAEEGEKKARFSPPFPPPFHSLLFFNYYPSS